MLPFRVTKPVLDIGLFSDNPAMLDFYDHTVAMPFVELLQHSPTYQERFYSVHGASLKINYSLEPMADGTSGYRGLLVARDGLDAPSPFVDPDGSTVTLVPAGTDGITTLGVRVVVADAQRQRDFLVGALGAEEDAHGLVLGDTRIVVEQADALPYPTPTWRRGFNYILVPVDDVEIAHAHVLDHGATHGLRPIRLADRCVFSWVRDPHGNWIELVQYTDSGPLPDIERADSLWPLITEWRDHGTSA
jgi:lactoylglutathione lyase